MMSITSNCKLQTHDTSTNANTQKLSLLMFPISQACPRPSYKTFISKTAAISHVILEIKKNPHPRTTEKTFSLFIITLEASPHTLPCRKTLSLFVITLEASPHPQMTDWGFYLYLVNGYKKITGEWCHRGVSSIVARASLSKLPG